MLEQDKEIVIVGATSKFGVFILRYPLKVMLIIVIASETFLFMAGDDIDHLLRGLWIQLLAYGPMILLVFITSKKWCYRIEINKSNNTIVFYRLFNREVHTFRLEKIKIVIGAYCHILINDSEFILHAQYIHDLVSYIPKDSIIEYKGRFGKWQGREWERNNKPLIPGSRF
jgi:hypothetical protein